MGFGHRWIAQYLFSMCVVLAREVLGCLPGSLQTLSCRYTNTAGRKELPVFRLNDNLEMMMNFLIRILNGLDGNFQQLVAPFICCCCPSRL